MKKLLELALKSIESMSSDQFAARIARAKMSPVAIALRDLEELSMWSQNVFGGTFNIEQVIALIGLDKFSSVSFREIEEILSVCAANDERFALAA
ncbi:hypothetical protein [Comamonas sp.]|uniref:hypothetical protein n=1 Tax=Comamonas sp. TaxID=34028 RepID=UPI003D0DF52D